MKCRHCASQLQHTFLDLGFAPPSNAYLRAEDLRRPEKNYPLRVLVCDHCWLVQTEDYAEADELFSPEYAYFSSTSTSWLQHAAQYAQAMTRRLELNPRSFVIEVASNDGYLLKNFVAARIPCLGIEPTASTAEAAEKIGVPVLREFFGEALGQRLARQGQQADLIAGNNVYAHVPDINDFTRGLAAALKPHGTITLEFPHLLKLIEQCQFDTIYHEHFSYLSLNVVDRIFRAAGLRIFDVEELPTHGGSLRVFGCHQQDSRPEVETIAALLARERCAGLEALGTYAELQARAEKIRDEVILFLIDQKRAGRKVAAYGAAAKGNTLLNFCGIKPDLLSFVCDAAPAKQGLYLPGSHVPILPPAALLERKPDDVLILPWNLSSEVVRQLTGAGLRDVRYVTAIPELRIQGSP